MTPEQLAEAMQNVRCKNHYFPADNVEWKCLNDYDKAILVNIARFSLRDIECHKECKCEEYPNMRQFALDLKAVLEKYIS